MWKDSNTKRGNMIHSIKKSKRKNSTRDLLYRIEVGRPQCYLDIYASVTSVTSVLRIGNEEWQKNSGCEGQCIQYMTVTWFPRGQKR